MTDDEQSKTCELLNENGFYAEPGEGGIVLVADSKEALQIGLEKQKREYDVVVVGGGSSMRGIGLSIGGRIGATLAALAIAQHIEMRVPEVDPLDQPWESESKPKHTYSKGKHLSAGERKHRNKKLKSQRNSRRYNRKG